jgi:hypothetical protein
MPYGEWLEWGQKWNMRDDWDGGYLGGESVDVHSQLAFRVM